MGYPDNGGTSGQNGFDAHECSPPALQESRAPSRKGVHCRKCWATLDAGSPVGLGDIPARGMHF